MRVRYFIALIVFAICLTFVKGADCDEGQPSEPELKAVFLYNFAKFIQWPTDSLRTNDSAFIIGIIGDNPFGDALKNSVEGKQVRKQKVHVLNISSEDSLADCEMLFVCASEKNRYENILKNIAGKPILTVGETTDFIDAGGIIGFYMKDNMVRFIINVEAAAQADLNISSKLLKLAKIK